MKIAVTYNNGQIFQHFGHTETFKVYQVKDGNRTVAQLKVEREQEYQQEVERPALYFGESKIEQGLHF